MVKLNAPQAYKVVHYLLKHKSGSYREIMKTTGVSERPIKNVFDAFLDIGAVTRGKWRILSLEDPIRVLDMLSIERQLKKLTNSKIRLQTNQISKAIAEIKKNSGDKYAFTCFVGLDRYFKYHLTIPMIHIYTNSPNTLKDIMKIGLGPIEVELLLPDHKSILLNSTIRRGIYVVDPIQIVIDLFCLGSIGRDGAIKLYEAIENGKIQV